MAFAAFDLFGGVVTHRAAVTGGFDALTVQNGGCRATTFVVASPHQDSQSIVNYRPLVVGHPLSENMINGFLVGKNGKQIAPRTAAFDQIEDGINDPATVFWRSPAFGQFGEHGLKAGLLDVGQVGVVLGDFHRLTGATAKGGSLKTSVKSNILCVLTQYCSHRKYFPIN